MIVRILTILAICTFIIFVVYWMVTGGLMRFINTARHLDNPFSMLTSTSTGGMLKLPWQPDELLPSAAFDDSEMPADSYADPQQQINTLQNQYDDLVQQAKDMKTFGNPSPDRGKVSFQMHDTAYGGPEEEYVQIAANFSNTAPISLAGWSLQSAVTAGRISLPPAAPLFTSGTLNSVDTISLAPGASATIVSGPSPVGVSFRENHCSGYLSELQTFTPELSRDCYDPSQELELSAENLQVYGESCVDYVRGISWCHFPGADSSLQNVSPACRDVLINRLSYNGCVFAHKNDTNFSLPSWRIYLGSGVKLWRPAHDIIRLLDQEGRTVDVLTY